MINTSSNLGEYREAINNLENNYLPKSGGTMTGNIAVNQMYANRPNSSTTWGIGATWNDAPSISLYGPNAGSGVVNGFQIRAGANTCSLTGKPDGTLTWNGANVITSAGGTTTGVLYVPYLIVNPQNDDLEGGEIRLTAANGSNYTTIIDNYNNQSRILGQAQDNTVGCYLTLNHENGAITWGGKQVRYVTDTYNSGTTWYRVWSDGWIEQGGKYTGASGTCWSTTITFPKAFSNTNYNISVTSTGLAGDMWGEHGENVESITTSSFKYYFYTGASGDGTTGFYWTACGY